MARRDSKPPRADQGNFISEWFGHRVYPVVASGDEVLGDQKTARCPFLSAATRENRECIKSPSSKGVCTISSTSNGPRQDWLVCPYRALDPSLLEDAARRVFDLPPHHPLLITPATALAKDDLRGALTDHLSAGNTGVVYLQDKLGGEISLPATDRSPELALDVTMVEVVEQDGQFALRRYGILEVPTMDFHGSYKHAVDKVTAAQTLYPTSYPEELARNPHWLADHVEGPNIANVFKRTFYQMVLKFQVGAKEPCGGCVLAIPTSVWDSWQRHLGRPTLDERGDGTFSLWHPHQPRASQRASTWTLVFDIATTTGENPSQFLITKAIATEASALAHYALEVAPQAAVADGVASTVLLASIHRRLKQWWPALQPSVCP